MRLFGRSNTGLDAILNRPTETLWDRLLASPLTTIARLLRDSFPVSFPIAEAGDAVTVVCISDTHNTQPRLPPGDILVHAGDLTASGTVKELRATVEWIKKQPHRHKVVVAGNHDLCLDGKLEKGEEEVVDWGDVIYLNRSSATLQVPVSSSPGGTAKTRNVRVYGSPYTPKHGDWAFQYPRSQAAQDPWAGSVPDGTDVLITHAPPKGHMDDPRGNWGCEMLSAELWRARPRLHVFGHVHCGHGREAVGFDALQGAYEDVVLEEAVEKLKGGRVSWAGLRALGRVVKAWVGVWWRGGRRGVGETVVVNAAVVGGIGDRLVREPIVVRI
ncbi:phosphoric ester hydrolase [Colletotrichum musicola]|uniref:Phosphoric ester hydrolase n=1 Tax=Colletotrichum musicola TaxID=2175873 RepID=A0A8H6KJZ4_9PEZI|nr:phosphoric ester hydrolase [Colletotrichum musicola]